MTDNSRKGRPGKGDVKALAVDIDGTLADDSRRVNLDAIAALRKVQDSGVEIMLASGKCATDSVCPIELPRADGTDNR